jgi:hypothetical protein
MNTILKSSSIFISLLLLVSVLQGVPNQLTIGDFAITYSQKWKILFVFISAFSSIYFGYFSKEDKSEKLFLVVALLNTVLSIPFLYSNSTLISTVYQILICTTSLILGFITSVVFMAFDAKRSSISGSQFSKFPVAGRSILRFSRMILMMFVVLVLLIMLLDEYNLLRNVTNNVIWAICFYTIPILCELVPRLLGNYGPKKFREQYKKKQETLRKITEMHEYMYQLGGYYPLNSPKIPELYKNVIEKDIEAIKKCLNNGDDPNTKNNIGWTILSQAVADGSIEIAQLLLSKGANPNTTNGMGRSPICYAAAYGNNKMIELLLEYGAKPNFYEFPEKLGPLLVAIKNKHVETVKLICDKIRLEKNEHGQFEEYELATKMKVPEIIEIVAKKIQSQGNDEYYFGFKNTKTT